MKIPFVAAIAQEFISVVKFMRAHHKLQAEILQHSNSRWLCGNTFFKSLFITASVFSSLRGVLLYTFVTAAFSSVGAEPADNHRTAQVKRTVLDNDFRDELSASVMTPASNVSTLRVLLSGAQEDYDSHQLMSRQPS
jgi:hypothetical protein